MKKKHYLFALDLIRSSGYNKKGEMCFRNVGCLKEGSREHNPLSRQGIHFLGFYSKGLGDGKSFSQRGITILVLYIV